MFLLFLIPIAHAADLGFRNWGIRGGLSIDPDQGHVGVHVNLGEITENLRIQPNVEIGFGDHVFLFMLNGETFYLFNVPDDETRLYAGGELSIVYWNVDAPGRHVDDVELGLSAVGGIEIPFSRDYDGFFELKLGLGDVPDFRATVGLNL
jgi:hypothetical protein